MGEPDRIRWGRARPRRSTLPGSPQARQLLPAIRLVTVPSGLNVSSYEACLASTVSSSATLPSGASRRRLNGNARRAARISTRRERAISGSRRRAAGSADAIGLDRAAHRPQRAWAGNPTPPPRGPRAETGSALNALTTIARAGGTRERAARTMSRPSPSGRRRSEITASEPPVQPPGDRPRESVP